MRGMGGGLRVHKVQMVAVIDGVASVNEWVNLEVNNHNVNYHMYGGIGITHDR